MNVESFKINPELRSHMIKSLDEGIRFDGRKSDEFRKITIETGVTRNAEGSARVKIGETEVICGVKMGMETPYPDTPDNGNLAVNVELLPLSNERFERGPPGIEAIELARVIDRGIRESGAIDVKNLCLTPGEKVWGVFIDLCTLNDAGNLFDAFALGAIAALKDTRYPAFDGTEVNYKEHTEEKLPLSAEPIEVTTYKVGKHFIVDPSFQEQECFDARLTVAFSEDNTICAMQKGGDEGLTIEDIDTMIELSKKKSAELRSILKGN
jgi:exosome complex component RRP42